MIAVRVFGPPDVFNGHPDMIEGGYWPAPRSPGSSGASGRSPELSGYRLLLDNVYGCSSNMHSGSGIGRGSSYNCWQTIARDLAIDPG